MQELEKEDIPLGEYEKLYCRNVYEYLTRNNKPQEQKYYRTDDGKLWEISYFHGKESKEFAERLSALEYLQKKIDIAGALGF